MRRWDWITVSLWYAALVALVYADRGYTTAALVAAMGAFAFYMGRSYGQDPPH